jgi:hypothetical protein
VKLSLQSRLGLIGCQPEYSTREEGRAEPPSVFQSHTGLPKSTTAAHCPSEGCRFRGLTPKGHKREVNSIKIVSATDKARIEGREQRYRKVWSRNVLRRGQRRFDKQQICDRPGLKLMQLLSNGLGCFLEPFSR